MQQERPDVQYEKIAMDWVMEHQPERALFQTIDHSTSINAFLCGAKCLVFWLPIKGKSLLCCLCTKLYD